MFIYFKRAKIHKPALSIANYLYVMLTIGAAFYRLKCDLQLLYDEREAAAIAHIVMEHITGMGKLQRLNHKDDVLNFNVLAQYEAALASLRRGVPVQHITGKAWFAGNEFIVNEHVLIPRPETEELVQWIVSENSSKAHLNILDVGTGSGCIPITLKLQLPQAAITSCDVSAQALEVAKGNAAHLSANVNFLQLDFLDEGRQAGLGIYDIIVSNPPYIPLSERDKLHKNVREHEPHLALFVPDEDSLIFYGAIAKFGLSHLAAGGSIYCELDADHAVETKVLFEEMGYNNVVLRADIHGNNRMLHAHKLF
jgi:release factor glutamine methyltransferase